jgi:hypothetical protein
LQDLGIEQIITLWCDGFSGECPFACSGRRVITHINSAQEEAHSAWLKQQTLNTLKQRNNAASLFVTTEALTLSLVSMTNEVLRRQIEALPFSERLELVERIENTLTADAD